MQQRNVNTKPFVERHQLVIYFALAFTITWVGSFLAGGATRLAGNAVTTGEFMRIALAMLAGPSIAGLVMTAAVGGRTGLRDLGVRMGRWRVSGRWYLVAVLTTPVVLLSILFTLAALVSPAYRPGFNILYGIAVGVLAGFLEENGWSGFATPRLLQKHSVLTAGLLLGVPWGLWHMMAGFLGSTPGQEIFWLTEFLLFWVITVTAYRVLMTWVYSKTESVLTAQIMHAFFSGTLATVLPVVSQTQTLLYEVIFAVCLWMLVGLVAVAERHRLAQQRSPAPIT